MGQPGPHEEGKGNTEFRTQGGTIPCTNTCWGPNVGKELGKEGPVGAMELPADHEPMVHPCGKPDHWIPQLLWAERVQQVQGGDPTPLLSVGIPLECCAQLCASQNETDIDTQPKAIEMLKGWEHLLNRERLRELGLSSLERRRLR
ncbi:hypothetical protein TURU_107906 [Turdus rufiventris]|nr:hypothetical protein TURU_107906 [Turdus rufiventris]